MSWAGHDFLQILSGVVQLSLNFVLAYGLPGRLLLDLLVPDAAPEERFPFSLALGLTVVNITAILVVGLAGLAFPVYLTGPVMWGVVAGVILVLAGLRLLRRGWDFRAWLRRPSRLEVALLATTALVATVFLVRYDRDLFWEESCMVRASTAVHADVLQTSLLEKHTGGQALSRYQLDPQHGPEAGRNNFLTYNQGEPLGPTVILAPFIALFGQFAYRLLYALPALSLLWAGFLLGRRVLARDWAAWATGLLLVFSPYAIEVRTYDENFLASAFGTVALVMLTRQRVPIGALAVVASSYFGLRQPLAVVVLPFVLAYLARVTPLRAWRGRVLAADLSGGQPGANWRVPLKFLGLMTVVSAPYLIKHVLFMTLNGGTLFVGAFERPSAPHSFLGVSFELKVLLNYPFIPEPLRSPYMAYPTLAAFPLDLLRRFGWVLAALVPLGLAWLIRAERRLAWLMVAWVAPLLALLMVQSNWVEPNKMGVPATALAPVVLVVMAGAVALTDRGWGWRRRASWLALGVGLPLACVAAVRDWRAPVDARVFDLPLKLYDKIFSPGTVRVLNEAPEYVEWDRQNLRPGLWPDWHTEWLHPALIKRALRRFADVVSAPGFESYDRAVPDELMQASLGRGMVVGPIRLLRLLHGGVEPDRRLRPLAEAPPGADVPMVLDLSGPFVAPVPLAPGSVPGPVVNPGGPRPVIVSGLRVPWADHPVTLLAARDPDGTVFLLLMPGLAAEGTAGQRVDPGAVQGLKLNLRLARGDLVRLIDVRVIRPARWYSRWFEVGEGGVWGSPPRALSPS
jgi:hypothetical protein